MKRSLQLYLIYFKSTFAKLNANLGKEIVVGICASVIFALMFYIFNDFLNVTVKDISIAMQYSFAYWSSLAFAIGAGAFLGKTLKKEFIDPHSISQSFLTIGESPKVLRYFNAMRAGTLIIFTYTLYLWLLNNYFWSFELFEKVLRIVIITIIAILFYFIFSTSTLDHKHNQVKNILPAVPINPVKTLALWKWEQLLKRNKLAFICFLFAGAFLILSAIAFFNKAPIFVPSLSGFMSGLFMATAIYFQIAEDLQYSWVEKNFGVSHQEYLGSIFWLAVKLSIILSLATSFMLFSVMVIHSDFEHISFEHLKIIIISILPLILSPFLVFQIDGKKPVIQIVLTLLVGIFIATAIFASWIGFIILPFFFYYANRSQWNHFYRT